MSFVKSPAGMLLMNEAAMAELGWHPGQHITRDQMWEGIAANSRALCRSIEMRGEDIDTSSLAKLCGHQPLN